MCAHPPPASYSVSQNYYYYCCCPYYLHFKRVVLIFLYSKLDDLIMPLLVYSADGDRYIFLFGYSKLKVLRDGRRRQFVLGEYEDTTGCVI